MLSPKRKKGTSFTLFPSLYYICSTMLSVVDLAFEEKIN